MKLSGIVNKLKKKKPEKLTPLQKFTLYFFQRPRKTALLALILVVFGAFCYTTLLKREGFPNIDTPIALGQGTYLVDNPTKVDKEVAEPLSKYLLKQDNVKSVRTQSFDNFYSVIVSYEEETDSDKRTSQLLENIEEQSIIPKEAKLDFEPVRVGLTQRGDDLVVSFYDPSGKVSTEELVAKAKDAANYINDQNLSLVEKASVIDPYKTATNPFTGQEQRVLDGFERFGKREDDETKFYNSVVIGIDAKDNADGIKLDNQVSEVVDKLNDRSEFEDFQVEISASNKSQIEQQIDELQTALLEGLVAILFVGSIVIAVRASVITVISMFTVIAIVNAILYLSGYSLNTITLFSLILGLALIVDDTIIMVEAIDARRRRSKDPDEVVTTATKKIAQAMIAATLTAALSFAPLLFVGGILGTFIKAIPITIMSALGVSLLVALVFIPLFARYLLLGKKQLGAKHAHDPSVDFEARIAEFLAKPMLWARHSKLKLVGVGLVAVLISTGFIVSSGIIAQKVEFNIFPSAKDANKLSVTISFPNGTTIEQAASIADEVDRRVAKELGGEFVQAAYYDSAGTQRATLDIDITNYKDREVKSPYLVEDLQAEFDDYTAAQVEVAQIDAGPPASDFTARIDSGENREAAQNLANDIASFLEKDAELTRPDKSVAEIESVSVSNKDVYDRDDNKPFVAANAVFKDNDTTTLVSLAQQAVEKEFDRDRVKEYGLEGDAISFDFGQENDNQDSFQTMIVAFPILLAVIFVLLAFQFRSFLQPILIFMAIPFSLFGVTLGLYQTNNPFSFFAMLGFFALIGLSIKNTILLTDYANQARRRGNNPVDAIHQALAERFRPLVATSLTAVVSLIPLALASPFWEGLAVVLIFGLLSSTFLVLIVFPYYYLGVEYIRIQFKRYVTTPVKKAIKKQLR